ncbi:hypothetical protein V6Z11_A07G218600 [Gossypium hirsutum]
MDGAVRSPSLITDSSSQMVLVDSGEISTRNPSSTSISTKKGEEIHGLLAWNGHTEERGKVHVKEAVEGNRSWEPDPLALFWHVPEASSALGC